MEPGFDIFSLQYEQQRNSIVRVQVELIRVEWGQPVNNGGATNEQGGKSWKKWVALRASNFKETKTQEDENTEAQQSIADRQLVQ